MERDVLALVMATLIPNFWPKLRGCGGVFVDVDIFAAYFVFSCGQMATMQ